MSNQDPARRASRRDGARPGTDAGAGSAREEADRMGLTGNRNGPSDRGNRQ